jgi:hypothetical protein
MVGSRHRGSKRRSQAGGREYLKTAPDFLQSWPVSKRVNSSKADADDATLIEA